MKRKIIPRLNTPRKKARTRVYWEGHEPGRPDPDTPSIVRTLRYGLHVAEDAAIGEAIGGWGLMAAGPAAAEAGAVVGRAIGAAYGAYTGRAAPSLAFTPSQLVSQTIKMKGNSRSNAERVLTNRSAMIKSGRSKVKKEKKVKVSKSLRSKVLQVMEGDEGTGCLKILHSGYVCAMISHGNSNVNVIQYPVLRLDPGWSAAVDEGPYGIPNQIVCMYGGDNRTTGRTYWNMLTSFVPGVSATRSQGNTQLGMIPGSELNFFTIGKIWNAASVLFNEKQLTCNPYYLLANLTENVAPGPGTAIPTAPGTLKINLKSSYVKFTMKNVSARVVTVEFWELEPTIKFNNTPPLNSMRAVAGNIESQAGYSTKYLYLHGANKQFVPVSANEMYMDLNTEWVSHYNAAGFKYRAVKRKMIIAPQETCVHTMQGPSGVLDLNDCYTDGNLNTGALKGFTKSVVIAVSGDQVLKQGNLLNIDGSGRYIQTNTAGAIPANDTSQSMPIAMEVEEFYKVAVPNVTGFIKNTDVAGTETMQLLNQRRDRYIYWNRCPTNGKDAIYTSNEVTPSLSVPTFTPSL